MPRIRTQRPSSTDKQSDVDFAGIAYAALATSLNLVSQLLPDGRLDGHEWTALNPTRNDRRLGSFRINLNTGQWSDFATDEGGNDLIALVAYVHCSSQSDAARWIEDQLGRRPV